MQLSKDFSAHEFRCRCGTCGLDGSTMDPGTIQKLQTLRDRVGMPLVPVNGIRCTAHNMQVGGANNSYHLIGRAIDLETATSYTLFRILEENFRLPGKPLFNGIGINNGSIHLDDRPLPVAFTYYESGKS